MKLRARLALILAMVFASLGMFATSASAEGHCDDGYINCYSFWEVLLAQHHGKVQIKASVWDSGRHAKRAYLRFIRAAGPALDTGRMYTTTATSKYDTTLRVREEWVWDSPFWGDEYTTYGYYGFIWW